MKITFLSLLLLLCVVMLGSCGVQVNAVLSAQRSASLTIQATVHPVLESYIKDLSGNSGPIFDPATIQKRLATEKGITVKKIEPFGTHGISVAIQVDDVTQLFATKSGDVKSALSITELNGVRTLKVRISRSMLKTFLTIGTNGDASSIDYLMPQKDGLNARQYQDQLNWALEEYGTATELADMFKSSVIKVSLKLPAPVQSARGFSIVDRNGGVLSLEIKLLDLMTMTNDLNCEAVY